MELPVTPYTTADGESTTGWSGTDTSRDRARKSDKKDHQMLVIRMLSKARFVGCTVVEIRDRAIPHHGTASGTLSNLHKAGKIARLADRRSGAKVYVLPEFVNGRETEPFGRNPDAGSTAADRRPECPNRHAECEPTTCPVCEQS
jgi:hypothetical protein